MYIIRALGKYSDDYTDISKFRTKKEAQKEIINLSSTISEEPGIVKNYLGIHQFVHYPLPEGEPIIYYIAVD